MSQAPHDSDPHAHIHHSHIPHSHPLFNGTDYETANKHYFDATAHQYSDRHDVQRRAEKIGQAMKNTGLFKQGITTVMDFACGTGDASHDTGLVSRVLAAEDPKSIVGVDISQGMVDQYNKVVSDHGIPPEEMKAICVTAHNRRLEGLQDMTFDVIICAAAYHHFPSIDEVTETLVSYLNPGGSLLVADLVHGESTHEVFPEDAHHIVVHRGGFTEEDIRSTFEKAGLKNITFEIVLKGKHHEHAVDLFLARGDK